MFGQVDPILPTAIFAGLTGMNILAAYYWLQDGQKWIAAITACVAAICAVIALGYGGLI